MASISPFLSSVMMYSVESGCAALFSAVLLLSGVYSGCESCFSAYPSSSGGSFLDFCRVVRIGPSDGYAFDTTFVEAIVYGGNVGGDVAGMSVAVCDGGYDVLLCGSFVDLADVGLAG